MGSLWVPLVVSVSVWVGVGGVDRPVLDPAPIAPVDASRVPPTSIVQSTFDYVEVVTGGADPADSLPMVVALHYMTGTPQTSGRDYADLDFPARVILVAGKTPMEGGFSYFSTDYYEHDVEFQEREALVVASELAAFVDDLRAQRPTRGRTIVTGFSQGGDLSYLLAMQYPGLIGAALPMGARLLPGWRSANTLAGVAPPQVHVFHGEADSIVPIAQARDAAEYLTAAGFPTQLHAYPNVDHQYPELMKRDYTLILAQLVHTAL